MVQTASATATPEAVTPPTQPDAAATAASPTVSSPVAGLPGDARSSVLPVVLSDDVAAPSTAGADDSPLAGAASPSSTQPVSTSPQAATVLLPTAGARTPMPRQLPRPPSRRLPPSHADRGAGLRPAASRHTVG